MMNPRRIALLLATSTLFSGLTNQALANSISAASASVSCLDASAPMYYTTNAPPSTASPLTCTEGGDTATVTYGPNPTVSAQATWGTYPYAQASSASLTYYFEIEGGNSGDQVPVVISADALVTGNSQAIVSAQLDGEGANGGAQYFILQLPGTTTSFDGDLSTFTTATDGTVYGFDLVVNAGANGGDSGSTVTASVDPSICINPSFAGASNYSVVTSAGIGNTCSSVATTGSATPEPSSSALALTGLAGLGLLTATGALRRKLPIPS